MQHPLFYVAGEDAYGLFLHYQSKRRGFNAYVIGQLKECAKKFFDKDIRVLTHEDLSNKECKSLSNLKNADVNFNFWLIFIINS